MSKSELMKYANDPFWIRLRTFLFVLFWVIWISMLCGAVLIIVFAPGCPATASLPWWKKCALVRVNVAYDSSRALKGQLEEASTQVKAVTDSLSALQNSQMDGFLIAGLDPFFLANLDNSSQADTEKFRNALTELIQAAHDDAVKGKVIFALDLTQTSDKHQWFKESSNNGSVYSDFYLYKPEKQSNSPLNWYYNADKMQYYGGKDQGNAALNYADEELKKQINSIAISWVRTKLDGIQVQGDFYVKDSAGNVHPSFDVAMIVHKWVKSGGQNKALLVADSNFTESAVKEGEESAFFELSPESLRWKELVKANNLQTALKQIFQQYAQSDLDSQTNSTVTKDAAPIDVGAGWRSFEVKLPTSQSNEISNNPKYGKSIAEGVLAAFYLMPKSSPIITADGPISEELAHVNTSKFLGQLAKLRREQSESFLLGTTKLNDVNSGEVFAVSRVYKDKNTYLLLINFATTSQVVDVKGTPDASLFKARVVLTDSQHPQPGDAEVKPSEVKMEPKQVLILEFVPKE